MKLRQHAQVMIFVLLVGVMLRSAMAQENTKLLERIASLESKVQIQAQEISNLRNQRSNSVIPILALVVATIVALWNIYIGLHDRLRDRNKVTIEYTIENKKTSETSNSRLDAVYVDISSRQPISLQYWGVRTTEYIDRIGTKGKTLEGSEPLRIYIVKFGLKLPEGVEDIFEIKEFYVHDSDGNDWDFSKKKRRGLVKDLREAMSDDG